MTLFDALWDEIHDPNGGRLALSHHRATTTGASAQMGACVSLVQKKITTAPMEVVVTKWHLGNTLPNETSVGYHVAYKL